MFLRVIAASIPFLIVFALVIFPESSAVRLIRGGTLAALRPVMHIGSAIRLRAVPADAGGEEEEVRLRAENEILRQENQRLRSALGLEQEIEPGLFGARVLSFGREFGKEYLLVSAPQDRLPAPGGFVVDAAGRVVGRVFESSAAGIKVRIASNPDETLDAEIIPGGGRTLARGIGNRTFLLDLVSNSAPVREGDFVAARIPGVNRLLLFGQVARANRSVNSAFQDIAAVLLVQPETLYEVFLLPSQ